MAMGAAGLAPASAQMQTLPPLSPSPAWEAMLAFRDCANTLMDDLKLARRYIDGRMHNQKILGLLVFAGKDEETAQGTFMSNIEFKKVTGRPSLYTKTRHLFADGTPGTVSPASLPHVKERIENAKQACTLHENPLDNKICLAQRLAALPASRISVHPHAIIANHYQVQEPGQTDYNVTYPPPVKGANFAQVAITITTLEINLTAEQLTGAPSAVLARQKIPVSGTVAKALDGLMACAQPTNPHDVLLPQNPGSGAPVRDGLRL
jgi:hypothetical protein